MEKKKSGEEKTSKKKPSSKTKNSKVKKEVVKDSNNKFMKHQILIIAFSMIIIIILSLVASYAIFSKANKANEYNTVYVGDLEFSYINLSEGDEGISLASNYPIDDTSAIATKPYRFSVENTGTLIANYTVKIVQNDEVIKEEGCSEILLDLNHLRYKFDNNEASNLSSTESSTNNQEFIVFEGTLQAKESNIHEIRLWLNEASPNSVLGKHFHGKVVVELKQNNTTDPYNRPIEAVSTHAFSKTGENCTTYDDGVDTFLVGQCSKNYVWYSGKLWRVVLKNNEAGTIKLVTDNAITTITHNKAGNTAFENSYVDQWLNQEFLPTLHNASEYLVTNYVWNATLDASDAPKRPDTTTSVTRTVGLLNSYEYYTTYNNSENLATALTGYLNNKASDTEGTRWWLINPYNVEDNSIRTVSYSGELSSTGVADGEGIRPAVNLKSDVQIESGSGTKSDPYILKGDSQETIAGTTLLSTRYSGEYITFNNELYRIMNIENGLTKIIAVDKPTSLSSNQFHSAEGVTSFTNASIKTDLEEYYQSLQTSNPTAYNMIEPNTTWYLGALGDSNSDLETTGSYKVTICATVDVTVSALTCEKTTNTTKASIALPRVGEMFTSQITRSNKDKFWTLTPYSSTGVLLIGNYGYLSLNIPTYDYGARPSMYLKSTIKIASSNTGNGTYEKPYVIE